MKSPKAITTAIALAIGLAVCVPAVRADVRNQETWLTLNNPLRVSNNVVLQPGTYEFRLADSLSQPTTMVEVFDARGRHVTNVATENSSRLMPVPNWPGTGNAIWTDAAIQIAPGSDNVDTLVKWFYPGDQIGHKFTYDRSMERALNEEQPQTIMVKPSFHRHDLGTLTVSNNAE